MLHIANGDCLARRMSEAGLPGDIAAWAELLHEGPCLAGLESSDRRAMRAAFYASCGWGSVAENRARLETWDRSLDEATAHDEVILWVEDDLFDQLLLIRHLSHFARIRLDPSILGWVDLPRPGEGADPAADHLGLCECLNRRRPITVSQIENAVAAWDAFTSADPLEIQRFIDADPHDWPYLGDALLRHLEEYPSTRNGLSRLEGQILFCLDQNGPMTFDNLFAAATDERRPYLGNTTLLWHLKNLKHAPRPLVELTNLATWRITRLGREVLVGDADQVAVRGIDRWLGGVHLVGKAVPWRWDAVAGRLINIE